MKSVLERQAIYVKKCFLYCAGEYCDGYINPTSEDIVVAVDAGYETLKKLCIKPSLAVGDFDSLGFLPEDVEVIRHPSIKDDTDTVLAARYMLERGISQFYIFGAFGKRLDHSIANIQLMGNLAKQGAVAFAFDEGYTYTVIHNASLSFDKSYEGTVSAFAIGDSVKNVSMTGLKYTLFNAEIFCDNPIGVSNEFIGENASISVGDGILLVMFERKSALELPCVSN